MTTKDKQDMNQGQLEQWINAYSHEVSIDAKAKWMVDRNDLRALIAGRRLVQADELNTDQLIDLSAELVWAKIKAEIADMRGLFGTWIEGQFVYGMETALEELEMRLDLTSGLKAKHPTDWTRSPLEIATRGHAPPTEPLQPASPDKEVK